MKSRFHTYWLIAATIAPTLVWSYPARGERIPVKFLQEDFRIMRHALEEAHGGIYRYSRKAEMDRTFDRAYRKIDHPMTDLEFWRLAAPVVAHIKCGHTYLWFPKSVQTVPILAVDTSVIHDQVFGIEQYGESSGSLAGKEILSINGIPTHKLLGDLRSIITGDGNSQTAKDWEIGHDGGFGVYLHGLGISSPFLVDCRDREGKRERIELSGMTMPDFFKARLERHPALARHAEIKFLDEGKIAVLTIRQWSNYVDPAHKITFSDFLKKSFAQFRENGTSTLIIDVRNDSGGLDVPVVELFGYLWHQSFDIYRDINCNAREFDFYKYDPDAKPMPGELRKGDDGKLHVIQQAGLGPQPALEPHYSGRVFALMNGGSFSSSTEFLTLLHFHKRAQFIGEEPAGAYYGYTCGRMVCPILPNSKLELNFGILTFYLDVSGYKYSDHGVMPDYPVSYTPADLLAGKDKEMELALSLARSKN